MSEVVRLNREGRVLRVTLNRPEKRNALNLELCHELVAAFERGESDPAVGAILLDGSGKAFCAGMDLDEVLQPDTGQFSKVHELLFTIGARIRKPLVAAVHGPALAGGTGLVANCHVVLAAEDATFGLTEIRIGLWPFVIFRVVTAAVGERRATQLALTGRIISAQEARDCGLVHHVVSAADLPARAFDTAASLAAFSPTAIRNGLSFVQEIRGASWETAGEIARRIRAEVFASADFREGVRAFHEKRKPQWPADPDHNI